MKNYGVTIILSVVLAGCAGIPAEPTIKEARQAKFDALLEPFQAEVVTKIEAQGRRLAASNGESHIKNLNYCAYLRIAQDQQQQADDFTVAMLTYSSAMLIEFEDTLIDEVTRWNYEANYEDGVDYFRNLITGKFSNSEATTEGWINTCNAFADGGYTIDSGIGETQ